MSVVQVAWGAPPEMAASLQQDEQMAHWPCPPMTPPGPRQHDENGFLNAAGLARLRAGLLVHPSARHEPVVTRLHEEPSVLNLVQQLADAIRSRAQGEPLGSAVNLECRTALRHLRHLEVELLADDIELGMRRYGPGA